EAGTLVGRGVVPDAEIPLLQFVQHRPKALDPSHLVEVELSVPGPGLKAWEGRVVGRASAAGAVQFAQALGEGHDQGGPGRRDLARKAQRCAEPLPVAGRSCPLEDRVRMRRQCGEEMSLGAAAPRRHNEYPPSARWLFGYRPQKEAEPVLGRVEGA